jgi:UDP:flavonoid glycosyltransferase YjiC (YdhE family)
MAENASRVAWAGAGVSLPRRLVAPRGVRLAVRKVLGDESYARRARELAEWARENEGATAAAEAIEGFTPTTSLHH